MNFTYVNSQIKVIEDKILNKQDFQKLSLVKDEDFIKTLVDLGYGSLDNSLEKIINTELSQTKKFLDEVSPKKEYTDLFFLINDTINIKYLYKIKKFNVRDVSSFLNRGIFNETNLRAAIFEDDYSGFSKIHTKLLKDISVKTQDVNDPRTLSGIIDSEIYSFIIDRIKLTFNEALNSYFRTAIDFANIMSFIRIKNLNWLYEDNKEMFVSGGFISLDIIESLFDLKDEDIIRTLNSFYEEKLSLILKEYFKTNSLNILEMRLDNLKLNLMRKFKDDAFGIGIIMYYYLKKLAEAQNIRYIYADRKINFEYLLEY